MLAKPNQTLVGHSLDVLCVLDALMAHDGSRVTAICERFGLDEARFRRALRLAALVHDCGKAHRSFQERMRDAKTEGRKQTHALPSCILFTQLLGSNARDPFGLDLEETAAALAILAHHSQLHDGAFCSKRSQQPIFRLIRGALAPFVALCEERIGMEPEEGWAKVFGNDRLLVRRWTKRWYLPLIKRLDRLEAGGLARVKGAYSTALSLLTAADSLASQLAGEAEDGEQEDAADDAQNAHEGARTIHGSLFERFDRSALWASPDLFFDWEAPFALNDLQRAVSARTSTRLLVKWPCGGGKTLAALLFAMNHIRAGRANRIVFALPTQTTSNNMRIMLDEVYGFPASSVSLYHSNAYLAYEYYDRKRKSEGGGASGGEGASGTVSDAADDAAAGEAISDAIDIRDEIWKGRLYLNRITITTVDHLLLSLCHGFKYADRALGNLLDAVVIFDELHYYQQHTIGLIHEAFGLFRSLGVPSMVMSATVPSDLETLFGNTPSVGSPPYHEDGPPSAGGEEATEHGTEEATERDMERDTKRDATLLDADAVWSATPFSLIKEPDPLLSEGELHPRGADVLTELICDSDARRQIVILNTVGGANAVYEHLRPLREAGYRVLLYHSQFIRAHRMQKEDELAALFSRDRGGGSAGSASDAQKIVLVCTQVAEISLDISADEMYTQLAPMDALIQRAGRLHRRGNGTTPEECTVAGCQCEGLPAAHQFRLHIFPLDWDDDHSYLPYARNADEDRFLRRSWDTLEEGPFSARRGGQWLDTIYGDAFTSKGPSYLLRDSFASDLIFGLRPQERYGAEEEDIQSGKLVIRPTSYQRYEVTPCKYESELELVTLWNGQLVPSPSNAQYGLLVPQGRFWAMFEGGLIRGNEQYMRLIVDCDYSYEEGLVPERVQRSSGVI